MDTAQMKHHVMLDVDGTLIQSYQFDEECFVDAVYQVIGKTICSHWQTYPYVTDRGILKTVIEQHSLNYSIDQLEQRVKPVFIRNIEKCVKENPVKEVAGANAFVSFLLQSEDFTVSVATGGWGETAKIKLQSAGFNTESLIIASSNDHHCRVEIMKSAKAKADPLGRFPITYFGDAEWDVNACKALGVNLVIIGDRVAHTNQVDNYLCLEKLLGFVGNSCFHRRE